MKLFSSRAEKAQKEKQAAIDYRQVFTSDAGKRVLEDLFNLYHVVDTHKGDPFMEGQRSVVLRILMCCHVRLDEFEQIIKGQGLRETDDE